MEEQSESISYPVLDRLDNDFTYHPPTVEQVERYTRLRDAGKEFAKLVSSCTPASREQSLALTNIEQAVMWANAAIARNEKQTTEVTGS